MTVDLEKLQQVVQNLFVRLRLSGVESVEIREDCYWNISQNEMYDPLQTPSELDMGQLSEDWVRLLAIAEDGDMAIGYGLVWAAAILRRVGEMNVG